MLLTTITTYLSTIPPLVIVVAVALLYVFVFGGRWQWPMVVDAGMLAIYYWRPATWPVLLFVALIRHVPALARELVVIFRLNEFDGWTIRILLFVLPALRVYQKDAPLVQADRPGAFGQTVALPPMIEGKKEQAAPAELPLLLGEGLKLLNADPTAPHVGVIGATRLGKTTFVGVLLAHRQGEFVIATPKAAQYDPWFGADVARPVIDMQNSSVDYAPIEQAVTNVHQEMLRRNTPGASATPALTLVIDEWTQVVSELPNLAKKVINLLRMGAGCGIRLILMATDVNVRGWHMDGNAGVLDNLVFARVEDGRVWSVGRLDPNWRMVAPRRLDTQLVPGLAARVSLAGRGWAGGGDSLLGGLLGAGAGGNAPPRTDTNKQTHTDADKRIAMYMAWSAAGTKKEQARAIRHSMGAGLDDAEWAEANKRLANGTN